MNKLPLATALLATVAAFALWAAAHYLQVSVAGSDPSARQGVNESQYAAATSTSTEIPLLPEQPGSDCATVESELVEIVQASQSCRTDNDCTIFDYGYPIQCLTSVARSKISNLRREFRRYHAECEYRVYYDCPTGEMTRRARCRQNQCIVTLESGEGLSEDTLEHLGLGP